MTLEVWNSNQPQGNRINESTSSKRFQRRVITLFSEIMRKNLGSLRPEISGVDWISCFSPVNPMNHFPHKQISNISSPPRLFKHDECLWDHMRSGIKTMIQRTLSSPGSHLKHGALICFIWKAEIKSIANVNTLFLQVTKVSPSAKELVSALILASAINISILRRPPLHIAGINGTSSHRAQRRYWWDFGNKHPGFLQVSSREGPITCCNT